MATIFPKPASTTRVLTVLHERMISLYDPEAKAALYAWLAERDISLNDVTTITAEDNLDGTSTVVVTMLDRDEDGQPFMVWPDTMQRPVPGEFVIYTAGPDGEPVKSRPDPALATVKRCFYGVVLQWPSLEELNERCSEPYAPGRTPRH